MKYLSKMKLQNLDYDLNTILKVRMRISTVIESLFYVKQLRSYFIKEKNEAQRSNDLPKVIKLAKW